MVADNRAGDVIDFSLAQAFENIAPLWERLADGKGRRRGGTDHLNDQLFRIAQRMTYQMLDTGTVDGCEFGDVVKDRFHTPDCNRWTFADNNFCNPSAF